MSTKLNINKGEALKAFYDEYKHLMPDIKASLHKLCTGDILVDTLNDTIRRMYWALSQKESTLKLIHPCKHEDQAFGVLASITIITWCPQRVSFHGDHFTLKIDNDTKVKVYNGGICVCVNNDQYAEYSFEDCVLRVYH